ncbi:hypothetical protein G195_009301 [Phytophthora kernoviae 00238/432]|uniref:FIST domain-containing protein n=1 Tax=Phytophthora kernoviae 00238/432 TaxID=1284355 RepID=A0A8J4RXA8_9STRA|nr:hypothetical protein G195_009301 [Phytophthora kernoviae 00238/432]
MDRFKLDGVDDDGFDAVEPMRPSSFDMSFSLGSYPRSHGLSRDSDPQDSNQNANDTDKRPGRGEKGRLHMDELVDSSSSPQQNNNDRNLASGHKPGSSPKKASSTSKDAANIALRLEEKAHEAIDVANLCGKIPWKLSKRTQDVHIYRPATPPKEEDGSTRLYFRVSCEVKAHLGTIMEYLTPSDSSYFDIESQVFPGLLHAAVIKRVELPGAPTVNPNPSQALLFPSGASATTTTSGSRDDASSVDEDASEKFPHLQVKWHASRFAGRFVKPIDFFFVEYANIETMADGRKRGYGYIRSVESFKGDELAIRLAGEEVVIPPSVAKCKRAVISKGVYLVSPSNDTPGTYEVTCMMVIDFQKQFTSTVGAKIIHNFTERLIGIRDLLFNTLFRPIATPHFMLVSYSHHHGGAAVYEALARAAPDTLFMGGTSSAGVYVGAYSPSISGGKNNANSSSNHSRHRHPSNTGSHGPTVGLWGIYDPEGSYAILNADLDRESPREAARRCVMDGMGMLCLEPEESPDFVWTVMGGESDPNAGDENEDDEEELVTRAVNEVVDCSYSVVGGSSSRHGASGRGYATQLCSEGGDVGCVTKHGVCFAICCPSVEVAHGLFTCYDATDKSFVVTKANGRDLFALDHKPALEAINEATHGMLTDMTQRPDKFNLESNLLPAYYPVARKRRGAVPRGLKRNSSRFQILQPENSSRDLSLHLGAKVRLGERLHMMSLSPRGVPSKARRGLREAMRLSIPTMDHQDVIGCYVSVGMTYDRVLQGDLKSVADATGSAFPQGASLLVVSHGQQGIMAGGNEAVYANSMLTALLITNRKKSQKLNPLRPLHVRQTTTIS